VSQSHVSNSGTRKRPAFNFHLVLHADGGSLLTLSDSCGREWRRMSRLSGYVACARAGGSCVLLRPAVRQLLAHMRYTGMSGCQPPKPRRSTIFEPLTALLPNVATQRPALSPTVPLPVSVFDCLTLCHFDFDLAPQLSLLIITSALETNKIEPRSYLIIPC